MTARETVGDILDQEELMNELVPIREARPLDAYRMSTDAAGACREIVVATASTIQGRKFVTVEGWQAIAIAHGCTAGARDVEKVDGGVRAIGEIRRMSDGHVLTVAEGFVGEDEPTWYGGQSRGKTLPKRPDYAIRAMAQTRAISRACRSAFAHVVVMMNANLSTTPAEEVPAGGFDAETGEIIDARREKLDGIHKIKERLRAMLADGDQVNNTADFNNLVRKNKDDLRAIRGNGHPWWSGDGEDFEGFDSWIARRRAELADEESEEFKLLVETLQACASADDLKHWLKIKGDFVEALDDREERKFGKIFETFEAGLKMVELNRRAHDAGV